LRPAKRLSDGQRRVIEADYCMKDGEVRLEVRAALLGLLLRRLGLDPRQQLDRPRGFVEVANAEEVGEVLVMIEARFGEAG
jgi:hypothetical protein